MEIGIVALVLLAALLHAGWNAFVKAAPDRVVMIGAIALTHAVAGALVIPWVAVPHRASWPALAVSAMLHYGYYAFLNQAFRHGHLSQVYPLARGVAPVLVAVGAILIAGEVLGPLPMAGVAIASAGIASLTFANARSVRDDRVALAYALGTGLIIAAYSVTDGVGVRLSGSHFGYIAWLFLLELPVVVACLYLRRQTMRVTLRARWATALGAGVSSVTAYALVIYAMAFAPMAAVSALRETSVVMAALIGAFVLGERPWRLRLAAAVLVVAGVALVTTA